MVAKFLIWTYRHDYNEVWVRKYQWYYLSVTSSIFLTLLINRISDYWILNDIPSIEIAYWLSLFLINLNSSYLILDFKLVVN